MDIGSLARRLALTAAVITTPSLGNTNLMPSPKTLEQSRQRSSTTFSVERRGFELDSIEQETSDDLQEVLSFIRNYKNNSRCPVEIKMKRIKIQEDEYLPGKWFPSASKKQQQMLYQIAIKDLPNKKKGYSTAIAFETVENGKGKFIGVLVKVYEVRTDDERIRPVMEFVDNDPFGQLDFRGVNAGGDDGEPDKVIGFSRISDRWVAEDRSTLERGLVPTKIISEFKREYGALVRAVRDYIRRQTG